MQLADIVDTARYPIERPDSEELAETVAEVRESLAEDGCAVVRGFLRPEAVEAIAADSRSLEKAGKKNAKDVTAYAPYLYPPQGDWPEGHPCAWHNMRRNCFIPYDVMAQDSPLRTLYESRCLTDLIRRCTCREGLYLYGDPLGACTLSVQRDGQELPWHFDVAHFVVSILVEKPDRGGEFEYAPNIRSDGDERYEEVAKVLAGDPDGRAIRLELHPGDLQLFEGRYSLHRVTPVEGDSARSIALLSYCDRPGIIGHSEIQREQYGRVSRSPLLVEGAAARGTA